MDSAEEGVRVDEKGNGGSRPRRKPKVPNRLGDFADLSIIDDLDLETKRNSKKGNRPRAISKKKDEETKKNVIDECVSVDEANREADLVNEKRAPSIIGCVVEQSDSSRPKILRVYVRKRKNVVINAETIAELPDRQAKKPKEAVVKNDNEDNKHNEDDAENSNCNMCHQCQRKDKEVVRCQNCKRKRYCPPCLNAWYPRISKEDIRKKCPFCCNNCNCRACLRLDTKMEGLNSDNTVSKEEKIQCSKYILRKLLPHLKELDDEQIAEKQIEAKISGLEFEEVKPIKAKCHPDERVFCDNCKTSIFDLHRSCSSCSSDICLACSLEIRKGKLQTCEEDYLRNT